MSVLANIDNIKIPYPTEGVIRTAQLDDTVAPENSVQLAVNMNFDRVGAIQTRLGIEQYADDLSEFISNYGTLRNSYIPPTYDFISQLGDITPITATSFIQPNMVKVNSTKVALFWTGVDNDGFCQNYEMDEITGALSPLGEPLEFDTSNAAGIQSIKISDTQVLVVWSGASSHAKAQVFDVSADQIVAQDSVFEFDANASFYFTMAIVDDTHVIVFYQGSTFGGLAVILEIDLGTGAVTKPGSALSFDANTIGHSCCSLGDGTHFVDFYYANAAGSVAATFVVNTGTWAISGLDFLAFQASGSQQHNACPVDGTHVVDITTKSGGVPKVYSFAINPSTFVITVQGTPVEIGIDAAALVKGVGFGDGLHFAVFFSTVGDDAGRVQIVERASNGNMSLIANQLTGYDFPTNISTAGDSFSMWPIQIEENKVAIIWTNNDRNEGQIAMFITYGDPIDGTFLYAGHGDEVSNTTNGTWTTRRSGLAQVSKPRFSQFLNYIWMVNGNEILGGDPVATSNGGAFGTDLVPEGFPPGDFIHAGFEGRVWVANKTLGIIYYTDIVQFIPPVTYNLTYNPTVNFITQLTPQTGQSFTALQRVPRALLVFTQDSIFRIYGATSVDAYPAYNVGTFSQESIIETKTGIFFHHSSGFYQFDYGSQPVEISRRIIDFVKAIPRENYEDITGVWDGFDNVEWAIGQVVVEGVVFTNCMVRYTISTQVWTIYDLPKNEITAMIYYDDGENLNHLVGVINTVGAAAYKTGAFESGFTDFGQPFYYEFIDRWRAFTQMYYLTKSISGFNVYSENAAGANLLYQQQKTGPNAWKPLGTVTEANNALLPNSSTDDFDVIRLRLVGNTKGAQVVVHGIEITQLTIKGQEQN